METKHLSPEMELLFEQSVKELEEYAEEVFAEKGWRLTKCFSCGAPFLEKNWATRPQCPICKASRVD
jgi:rubrerythrin